MFEADLKLRIGQRAKIIALSSSPKYNGTFGKVTDYVLETGRYQVLCEMDWETKSLLPEQLVFEDGSHGASGAGHANMDFSIDDL